MLEGPAGIDSRHEAGATARCTAIDGRWVVRRRSRLDRAEQRETASARLAAGQPPRRAGRLSGRPSRRTKTPRHIPAVARPHSPPASTPP